MGQKRAVLVGINYPGTEGELKGCLNDVARMRRCLVERFGFDEAGIRVLADADPSTPPPTGANIRMELERLVGDARPGDTLFFHYSGHGLQLPAETGEDDDTGYDECIVPCDLNLIKGALLLLGTGDRCTTAIRLDVFEPGASASVATCGAARCGSGARRAPRRDASAGGAAAHLNHHDRYRNPPSKARRGASRQRSTEPRQAGARLSDSPAAVEQASGQLRVDAVAVVSEMPASTRAAAAGTWRAAAVGEREGGCTGSGKRARGAPATRADVRPPVVPFL
nr:unnamed protein product [Digitaria exilis]